MITITMKCFMRSFALILLVTVRAAAATYYIDFSAGSDSNSGTSTSTSWKRHPYMQGFTGSYSHSSGDRFIFKGGVSWPNACFNITVNNGGATGNPDYYGVDTNYYSGASWSRPIWDLSG